MSDRITVRAAAKINLHLGVGGVREDGFHALDTVYQAVSLYDDLTVTRADDWSLELSAAGHVHADEVPLGDANIVARAAALLGGGSAHVHIHKEIPAAGGMAGGSADGAAALVALDRLWDLQTPDDVLLGHAAALGSDVPFALLGGTAHGGGHGEVVTPIPDEGSWWWVLVPSDVGLSTPAVYRHFDELAPDADAPTSAAALVDAIASGDPHTLAACLHNDLQEAALDLRPELRAVLEQGVSSGALGGIVSGSGPTVALLCADADSARAVAGDLRASYDVVLVAHGPVAGAHVVT
jgi:4-diphosphocytidyl-2-C-methyl-D-erythritol kinase